MKFFVKTGLYRFTPGGFGQYRHLRRQRDSGYVHERDKHPVRNKHHHAEGWKAERQNGLTYRDYESYDEYVVHQRQKFDEILKMAGGFSNAVITNARLRFFRRFRHLRRVLPTNAQIICAGARQGTEVEVLRDLGFRNAIGIDLNPGPRNPFVTRGDFMRMDVAASSADLVYSNCVDHAFELDAFFAEHARVIKPDGYALYDLPVGQPRRAFEAVAWDVEETLFVMMLRFFQRIVRVECDREWKWILLQGTRERAS